METKRETRPQARIRIASKVAAISNNLESPGRERGGGISQRVRESDEEEEEGQNLWPDISSGSLRVSPLEGGGGEGSVGWKMRNTKKGVNAGRNESARRRMNRGGLINEIEVEYWRVIDELRRHFVIKYSYIFFLSIFAFGFFLDGTI